MNDLCWYNRIDSWLLVLNAVWCAKLAVRNNQTNNNNKKSGSGGAAISLKTSKQRRLLLQVVNTRLPVSINECREQICNRRQRRQRRRSVEVSIHPASFKGKNERLRYWSTWPPGRCDKYLLDLPTFRGHSLLQQSGPYHRHFRAARREQWPDWSAAH